MASRPEFPAQALQVLAALCEQPTTRWQDGSALAMQTDYRRSGCTRS
jgi:hypothetical protein